MRSFSAIYVFLFVAVAGLASPKLFAELDRPLLIPAPGSPIASPAGGSLVAGDVNCDGIADLVMTVGNSLNVLFGSVNRVWSAEPDVHLDLDSPASEIALVDINRDGYRDLILTHHDSYAVTVL